MRRLARAILKALRLWREDFVSRCSDRIRMVEISAEMREGNRMLAREIKPQMPQDELNGVFSDYYAVFDVLLDESKAIRDRRATRLAARYLVPIPWEKRTQSPRTLQTLFPDDVAIDLFRQATEVRRAGLESTARLLTPVLAFIGAILGVVLGAFLKKP